MNLALPSLIKSILFFGTFILFTGRIWIPDGSAYRTQTYLFLFLPALALLFSRGKQLLHYRPSIPELLLLVFCFWVLVRALETSLFLDYLRMLLLTAIFFWVVYLLSRNERQLRNLVLACGFMASFGALASLLYQFFLLEQPLGYREYRIYRLGILEYADLGHPVIAGIFFGHFAVALFTIFCTEKLPKFFAGIILTCALILLTYVFCTYSRGAWLATAGALFTVIFLCGNKKTNGILIACIPALTVLVFFKWELLYYEISVQGSSGRLSIWKDVAGLVTKRPLFGYGSGYEYQYLKNDLVTLAPPSHSHSLYLQILLEWGLIGFILFLFSIFAAIKVLFTHSCSPIKIMTTSIVVYISIAAITDIHSLLTMPGPYWPSLFFPLALLYAIYRREFIDQNPLT